LLIILISKYIIIYMTDVEQITKEPEEKIEKVKDPKKVAAGKRLAAANKKSKESSKEKEDSWFPDINFSTAIGIVGISLTAIDLYYRFSNREKKKNEKYKPKLETIKEEPPQQQQQKLIGML